MKLTPQLRLILFIVAAFIIDYIPLVNLPFLWSETFFHEISHGLAALLTGGLIHNISLNFNGSGLCTTSGGINFIVTFAGYAGSALWGLLIYRVAGSLSPKSSKIMVAVMVSMLAVTLVLWARDIPTIFILIVLLLMYGLPLYKSLWISVKSFIQLVGIFVLLDAIRSPLYLLDGRDLGDGATLASLTWIPEIVWVALWFAIASGCLYFLWKAPVKSTTTA
ncbi:MAG: M50 family metallopeptidase [Thiotrichaceae bacterium]|nr:M50 family metallopeptidase [Thiotrichaceae bacterium]